MNKEEIEKIKIKTQGVLYITNYKRFWNYFDNLQQENKQLKEETKKLKMIAYGLNSGDLFPIKICEYINKIEEEMNWEEYLKFQGDSNE